MEFDIEIPPLTEYIRGILNKYPDGGQILKELVQNAEDAGADSLTFILDHREYGEELLIPHGEGRGKVLVQGPALYAFNNAVFTQEDWAGIAKLGSSQKKDKIGKVGKFGIGFSSVYHLTDCPWILSGNLLAVLDPQRLYFPRSKKWDFSQPQHRQEWSQAQDQAEPWRAILDHLGLGDVFDGAELPGTLFRFPLRTSPSELSSTEYPPRRVLENLFSNLISDLEIVPLFLNNIKSIKLEEILNNNQTRMISKVNVAELDEGQISISIQNQGAQKQVSRFHIRRMNLNERRSSPAFEEALRLSDELKLLPEVAVAARIDVKDGREGSGRISVMLPLPDSLDTRTGLPVFINGFFALSDNRRSLKWMTEDDQSAEVQWNKLLVQKVIPVCYAELISQVTRGPDADSSYSLWPDLLNGSNWFECSTNTLVQLWNLQSLQLTNGQWIVPKQEERVIFDTGFTFPNGQSLSTQCSSRIRDFLGDTSKKIVPLYQEDLKNVLRLIQTIWGLRTNNLVFLNPNSLSEICLQRKDQLRSSPQEVKDVILMYVGLGGGDLANLPLLPLLSGEVVEFSHNNKTQFFVPSSQVPSSCVPSSGHQRVVKISTNEDTAKGLEKVLSNLAQRGSYGLQQLTIHNLPQIIRDTLPSTWQQGTSVAVNWDPNSSDQPSITNIQSIWRLLNTQPSYIYNFEGIPLIPSVPLDQVKNQTQNQLLKMKRQRKLAIVGDMHLSSIPKLLKDLAKEKILTWDPSKSLCPALLNVYVEPLDGLRLLNILEEVRKGPGYLVDTLLNNTQTCQDIVSYLHAHRYQISKSHIDLLKYMPLLGKIDGTFFSYVNQHPNRLLYSSQVPPMEEQSWLEELGITLIYCPKDDQRWLSSNILDISILHNATLAIKMLEKLQNLVKLKNQEERIVWITQHVAVGVWQSALKNTPFIPSGNSYVKMNMLFSHNDERLNQLFHNETNRFMKEGSPLRSISDLLQLKSWRDVTIKDLQQTAQNIEMSNGKNLHHGKLKALLEKSQELTQLAFISKYKIFPSMPKPTHYPTNLPWVSSDELLYTGSELIRSDLSDVVGSVAPVCHPEFSAYLVQSECDRSCYLADLIHQLKNIVKQNVETQASAKIYSLLQSNGASNEKEISSLLAGVPNGKWIATKFGFRSVNEVCFDPTVVNFHPYVVNPIKEIMDTTDFFQKLGIQRTLSSTDLLNTLENIQEHYRKMPVLRIDRWEKDREVIFHILNKLSGEINTQNSNILGKLKLPIREENKIAFYPVKDCFYNDVKNQTQRDLIINSSKSYRIVDLRIDNKLAEALKLRPVTDVLLNVTELGYGDALFVEEFGQQEPITRRIRGILEEYPEGSGIYKELIQNADDAGATEVSFFIDEQENRDAKTTLLGKEMEVCNGMSLWSYNNAKFTENDFQSLIKIGGATKRSESDKIGAFGLGFNSVYHLTDVPSIVSGKYLVYLDPNLTHIPSKYMPSKSPGIRINIKEDPEKLELFADQFKPYNIPLFNLKLESRPAGIDYNGTVIRLPLRNHKGAERSDISDTVYDTEELGLLSRWFQINQKDYLLFLPNVKSLTLLKGDSRMNPKEISCVSKEVIGISSNFGQKSIIKAASDFLHKDSNSPPKQNQFVTIDVKCGTETVKSTWIVSSLCSDKLSPTFCLAKEKRKSFGLNPVTSIAIKIGVDLRSKKHLVQSLTGKGNFFCYLPLNIPNGLNFHINGSFSVSSNRRNLWKDERSEKTVKGQWNKCLLEDNLVDNFIEALEQIKQLQKTGVLEIDKFDLLWPKVLKETDSLCNFSLNFYKRITEKDTELFYSEESDNWCTFENLYVLNVANVPKNVASEVKSLLLQILRSENPKAELVNLSAESKVGIKTICEEAQFQDKIYNMQRFYSKVFFPHFEDFDIASKETIIHFVLQNLCKTPEAYLEEHMKSTECIPTNSLKTFRTPDQIIDPESEVGKLFLISDDRFLDESYIKYKPALLRLGMKKLLSSDILEERAHFIQSMNEITRDDLSLIEPILKISDRILLLLKHSLEDSNIEEWRQVCSNLYQVKFLQKKPTQELDTSDIFFSPSQLWSPDVENYVSYTKPIFSPPAADNQYHLQDMGKTKILYSVLGIQDSVNEDDIVQQMIHYEKEFQNETLDSKSKDQIGKNIYQNLTRLALYDISNASIDRIKNIALYYHGSKLHHFSDLTCESFLFDLSPFLQQINLSTSCGIKKLLLKLGMIEKMGELEYCKLLNKIQINSSDALDESCINKVKHILERIAFLRQHGKSVITDELIAPNSKGMLTPVSKLLYNDAPWIKMSGNFIHETISRNTAIEIGVQMIKSKALESFKSADFPFGDPFGQQEPLTTRIRNILEEYPSGVDIFKEMLQNADDAEASEIHFIIDERIHNGQKVFNDNWSHLQGPSLCVYNNKPFTESDYDGIRRLGIGSKKTSAHSIGKYGIGFNSVYQITDTPMFTSNQSLCIFDPHIEFVTGVATKDNPGGKFELSPEFVSSYRDVLSGFNFSQLGWDFDKGTLFRLPLRQNYKSKIKNKGTDLTEMKSILDQFKTNVDENLLFLKYIKDIKISYVNKDCTLEENIHVTTSIQADKEAERIQFFENSKNSEVLNLHCSYDLKVNISGGARSLGNSKPKSTTYKVCWRVENINEDDKKLESEKKVTPLGAVAFNKQDSSSKPKVFVGLPLPEGDSTNLPVHINGSFELDHGRRGLVRGGPDSWNTYILRNPVCKAYLDLLLLLREEYAEVQSNDKERQINNYIREMENIYGSTEKPVVANGRSSEILGQKFELLFPVPPKENHLFFPLVDSFYNRIKEEQHEVIPCWAIQTIRGVGYQKIIWTNLDSCFFLNEEINKYVKDQHKNPFTLLHKLNYFIPTSFCFFQKFRLIEFSFITTENIISFLQTLSDSSFFAEDCKMSSLNLPAAVRSTVTKHTEVTSLLNFLLRYKTKLEIDEYKALQKKSANEEPSLKKVDLTNVPLLVTCDGKLQRFSRDRDIFRNKWNALLPSKEKHFIVSGCPEDKISEEFCSVLRIQDLATHFREILPRIHEQALPELNFKILQYISSTYSKPSDINYENQADHKLNYVKILGEFVILPVTIHGSQHFTKLENISNVLGISSDTTPEEQEVSSNLEKLGMPVLCIKNPSKLHSHTTWDDKQKEMQRKMDEENKLQRFFNNISANYQHHKSILFALQHHLERDQHATRILKKNAPFSQILQNYFSYLPTLKMSENVVSILKTLPIYFSFHNAHTVDLSLSKNYAYCPEWSELEGTSTLETVILTNYNNARLLKFIGLPKMSCFEAFRIHVLPSLANMSMVERAIYLKAISNFDPNGWISNGDDQTLSKQIRCLFSDLKSIKFVENKLGNKVAVSSLISDENVLLTIVSEDHEKMHPKLQEHLFGKPRNFYMTKLLNMLGLQNQVTRENVLMYIRNRLIPSFKQIQTTEYIKSAEKIISEILKEETLMGDPDFLQQLSLLKFIPCQISRFAEHLYDKGEHKMENLVCFSGSATYDTEDFIWSVLPVLPQWAKPKNQFKEAKIDFQIKHLNIIQIENIPFASIIEHFAFFCESYRRLKPQNLDLDDIYPELVQNLKRIEPAELKEGLYNVNCISLDGEMVKPKQTVQNCSLNVEPYIHKYPIEHGNLLKIFTATGVAEEILVRHCVEALEVIAINSQSQAIIDPNVQKNIKDLFEEFCNLFLKPDVHYDDTTILYLPSENFQLLDSRHLTFNDVPAAKDSLRQKLSFVATNNKFGQIIEKLPQKWRPDRLSTKIVARISEEKSSVCNSNDCHGASGLKAILSSQFFSEGVVRLIKHFKQSEENYMLPEIKEDTFTTLNGKMNLVKVTCYEEIKTVICNIEDNSEIEGTEAFKDAVVLSVYSTELAVAHKVLQHVGSGHGKGNQLANEIISLVKQIFNEDEGYQWTILKPYFSQMVFLEPNMIEKMLDDENIELMESLAEKDTISEKNGQPVPLDVSSCLLEDPLMAVQIGKIVVYQKESGVFVYAEIKEILEQLGTNLYKLIIDAGDDIYEEVSSLDIYYFPLFLSKKENVVQKMFVNNEEMSEGSFPNDAKKINDSVPDEGKFDKSLEEICLEITEQLEEAFKILSPEEKKKMIRRLYLKWHPDKNMNNVDIATEVTKHIQNEVDRLEKGRPRKSNDTTGNFTREEDFSDFWDSFFRSWDGMAQNQGRQRNKYYNNYWRYRDEGSSGAEGFQSGGASFGRSWDVPPSFQTNDIVAARTLLEEAKSDLEAARKMMDNDDPNHKWVAYIARMSLELSVKSAELCGRTSHSRIHNIGQLAANLPCSLPIRDDLVAAWDRIPQVFKDYNDILYRGLNSGAGSTSREFRAENAQDVQRGVAMVDKNFIRIVEEHLKALEETD